MQHLPLLIGYREPGNLQHGKSKPAFHSLPAVAPETLPISKLELSVAIANDFQSLTNVAKNSAEYLNLNMAPKDDY